MGHHVYKDVWTPSTGETLQLYTESWSHSWYLKSVKMTPQWLIAGRATWKTEGEHIHDTNFQVKNREGGAYK